MTDKLPVPTRQAEAIPGRSAPLKVTGRLARAIEQMVWFGASRAEAAEKAGLKDHSLRSALKKPHVLRHYHAELGVLRESTRAKNFHRLDSIADKSGNDMAKVAAVKAMEAISNDPVGANVQRIGGQLPGYVIDLTDQPGLTIRIFNPAPPAPMHDVTPDKVIDSEDPTIFKQGR
jgi:hypothetical protein